MSKDMKGLAICGILMACAFPAVMIGYHLSPTGIALFGNHKDAETEAHLSALFISLVGLWFFVWAMVIHLKDLGPDD